MDAPKRFYSLPQKCFQGRSKRGWLFPFYFSFKMSYSVAHGRFLFFLKKNGSQKLTSDRGVLLIPAAKQLHSAAIFR